MTANVFPSGFLVWMLVCSGIVVMVHFQDFVISMPQVARVFS